MPKVSTISSPAKEHESCLNISYCDIFAPSHVGKNVNAQEMEVCAIIPRSIITVYKHNKSGTI